MSWRFESTRTTRTDAGLQRGGGQHHHEPTTRARRRGASSSTKPRAGSRARPTRPAPRAGGRRRGGGQPGSGARARARPTGQARVTMPRPSMASPGPAPPLLARAGWGGRAWWCGRGVTQHGGPGRGWRASAERRAPGATRVRARRPRSWPPSPPWRPGGQAEKSHPARVGAYQSRRRSPGEQHRVSGAGRARAVSTAWSMDPAC